MGKPVFPLLRIHLKRHRKLRRARHLLDEDFFHLIHFVRRSFHQKFIVDLQKQTRFHTGFRKPAVHKLLQKNYRSHAILTDDVAREQMLPGGIAYRRVVEEFGAGILAADGTGFNLKRRSSSVAYTYQTSSQKASYPPSIGRL